MPFSKDNAAAYGRKGGGNPRKGQDPINYRTKSLLIKVSTAEYDAITDKAAAVGLSKTELIIRAVAAFNGGK
jgi:hypothetical protein